jgi:hypothetical protein
MTWPSRSSVMGMEVNAEESNDTLFLCLIDWVSDKCGIVTCHP